MKLNEQYYYLTIESIKPVKVFSLYSLNGDPSFIQVTNFGTRLAYDVPKSLLFKSHGFAEHHRDTMDFKHIKDLDFLSSGQATITNRKAPLSTYDRRKLIQEKQKYGYNLSKAVDYFVASESRLNTPKCIPLRMYSYFTYNPQTDQQDNVEAINYSKLNHGFVVVKSRIDNTIYEVPPTLLFDRQENIDNYYNQLTIKTNIVDSHRFKPSEYFKEDPYQQILENIQINNTYYSFNKNNSAPDKVVVTHFDDSRHGHVRVVSRTFDWNFTIPPHRLYNTLEDAIPDHHRAQPIEDFIEQVLNSN